MSGTEANAGQDPGLRSLVASVPTGGLVLVLVALAWWGEKLKQSPGETALENLLSDSPGFALFVFLPAMFLSLSVTIACLAMSTEVLVRRTGNRAFALSGATFCVCTLAVALVYWILPVLDS